MSNWLATFASHDSGGTLYENTIGVKMDPVVGDGLNATDLADEISSWLTASYRACLSALLTLDTITVRRMPFPTTEEGVKALGLAGTGGPDYEFPKECAVILAWKTDHPGRSGRGHIALPPPRTASFMTQSNWNLASGFFTISVAAFLAALDAGHDWTSEGVTDGHLSHIVYSRVDNAGYDVKARIVRPAVRWVQRRQTAP